MSDTHLYVNGIHAETGEYALPPQSVDDIVAFATKHQDIQRDSYEYHFLQQRFTPHFCIQTIDAKNLSETGWGIIFAHNEDQEVIDALGPLIEHRKNQVNNEPFFKQFSGVRGYKRGQSKRDFISRHAPQARGSGYVQPEHGLPYYLLIVGSFDKIPYEFQHQLSIEYAVGRIEFVTPQEYATYANNVVQAETKGSPNARKATFFGVRNDGDQVTQLSADMLVNPLFDSLQEEQEDWIFEKYFANDQGQEASKENLRSLLHNNPPALLVAASHGMVFPSTNPLQYRHQGALLCQDWDGPSQENIPIPKDIYFSGDDLASDAKLNGTIAFLFGSYSAGTPKTNLFAPLVGTSTADDIAEQPFIANLPRQMLLRGALAVVGHTNLSWGCSFIHERNRLFGNFQVALSQIMHGSTIGIACDTFNVAYAESATALINVLEEYEFFQDRFNPYDIVELWTTYQDSRSYMIIGDPAVRVPQEATESGQTEDKLKTIPTVTQSRDTKPTSSSDETSGGFSFGSGIFGSGNEESDEPSSMEQVKDSLANAIKALTTKLGEAFEDVATVKVSTYVLQETRDFAKQKRDPIPRAYTEIQLDGDMRTHIPTREDGEVDREIWNIHKDMVEQARLHRVEMLKLLLSAIPGQQHLKK